ncbi:hypothetical protein ABZ554_12430 [Streptomyces sp. NPDC020125]|uniref:hypothetical protein n=1 Tax=Streptomyces sp. NPDC020125 TaxID=3154593 RepID=UPI0033E00D40
MSLIVTAWCGWFTGSQLSQNGRCAAQSVPVEMTDRPLGRDAAVSLWLNRVIGPRSFPLPAALRPAAPARPDVSVPSIIVPVPRFETEVVAKLAHDPLGLLGPEGFDQVNCADDQQQRTERSALEPFVLEVPEKNCQDGSGCQ